MSRYIDADKIDFRLPYFTDDSGDVLVSLRTVKRCIDMTPTADVVSKKEITNVLSDLKIAIHNQATFNHAKEIPTYITLKTLDAIINNFIEKYHTAGGDKK